jgi:hypothetical protein
LSAQGWRNWHGGAAGANARRMAVFCRDRWDGLPPKLVGDGAEFFGGREDWYRSVLCGN